jgi:hypothetical protein
MSTDTVEDRLHGCSDERKVGDSRSRLETIALILKAMAEGLAASDYYEALVRRGVPRQRATRMVFEGIFGNR